MNRDELVEKMCEADCDSPVKAYPRQTSWRAMREFERDDWRKGMSAALDVAVGELYKPVNQADVAFLGYHSVASAPADVVEQIGDVLEHRRAQLEKVKTPSPEEYRKLEISLALSMVKIIPCQKCGYPCISGNCCGHCFSTNPRGL